MNQPSDDLRYKRSRFSARLPMDRRYAPSHFWLLEYEPGVWRVGFTKFALRMLGEAVEFEFEAGEGSEVETGQVVGWIEGFKAVTDVFCPMNGTFAGSNPALDEDLQLMHSSPYEKGWLFAVRGIPDAACLDAGGYSELLDATIDRMQGKGE